MGEFKRCINTTGKFKQICVVGENFLDSETGEVIELANILKNVYGEGQSFDMSTTQKTDDEITPDNE